jgi:hypothetical protein
MGIAIPLAGCVMSQYTNHIRGSRQEQIATGEKDSVHSPVLEEMKKCKKESCEEEYYKHEYCSKHYEEIFVGICRIADCRRGKYKDGKCYNHWAGINEEKHLSTTKSNEKEKSGKMTPYEKTRMDEMNDWMDRQVEAYRPRSAAEKPPKTICWRTGCTNYEYVGTKEFHDKNGLGACRKHFYEMENWSDERYLIEKMKQSPSYLHELNKRIDEVMGK